jgi:serine/threonine-protein kinase
MDRRHLTSGQEANTLGKYRLLAELGRGGMAEVYLAVAHGPAGFNKLAVLKQITPTLAEDPEFLTMFLDEARLAARLSHPNVVQTNEVGEDAGRYFIAMEYLEGQPLNRVLHRLGRDGGLPLGMHLRVLVEALAGLHHAHELTDYDGTPLGVVHRDATPHNVFLTYDGQVKVVDFGIAKAMNSSSDTRTGVLKGKVAYMSPEQARGDTVDRRADLFSVGVMIWEALAHRRLWKGMTDVAILHHVVTGEVPKPSDVRPGVPRALEAVCLRALALNPRERFTTALELQASLEAALDDAGERGSVRDAGKLVGQHFAEERAKIRAIVETQLRTASALPTSEYRALELPVLLEPQATTSGQPSDDPDRQHSVTPSLVGPGTGSPPSRTSASAQHPTPHVLPALPMPVELVATRSPRRGLIAVGVTAGVLAGAAGLWLAMRGPVAHEGAPVRAPEAAPAAAATPAPARQVAVKIAATPPEARLLLDGKPLAGNPFSAAMTADDRVHELRAEADGYEPRSRELRLDRDLELDLSLEPERDAKDGAGSKRGATKPVTAGGPAPTTEGLEEGLKPATKPKRAIDPNNPYAQ